MRYAGWRRQRGDTVRRPDLLDIGKKLLAALDQRRRRGAPATQVQRVTLPDGGTVVAGFDRNHPYVEFEGPGGEAEERTVTLYAVFTDFNEETDDGQVNLLRLERYALAPSSGTPVRTADRYRLMNTLGGLRDPNALAVTRNGERVATVDYGISYIELSNSSGELQRLREAPILAGQDLNFHAFYPPDGAALYANISGATGFAPLLARWLETPQAIGIGLSNEDNITAMCEIGQTGRYAVFVAAATSGSRLVVYNANTAEVEIETSALVETSAFAIHHAVASPRNDIIYVSGVQPDQPAPLAGFFGAITITLTEPAGVAAAGLRSIAYGGAPGKMAVSPSGRYIYVADDANSWVWRYRADAVGGLSNNSTETGDPVTQDGVDRMPTPPTRYADIAISLDGRRAYMTAGEIEPYQFRVFDVRDFSIVSTIQTGRNSYRVRLFAIEE